MPAAARALLFALWALAAPAYLQASDLCNTTDAVATSKFTLTVAPENLKENTNYTVTVSGADNFSAVQFQALDTTTNKSSGEWTKESGTHSCPDNNLLYNMSSKSYAAHWVSPNTAAASVEIRVYISEAGALYVVTQNLKQVSPNTSSTTDSPKVTGTTKPPATDVTNATHSTAKPSHGSELTTTHHSTTKNGSNSGTYCSCILIAIVQSMHLMFISRRQ